jgi:hypothetical protein
MIATLIWIAMTAVFAILGFVGFEFNANTPLQVGRLPFICFVIAAISLIVVITRLAV